MNESKVTKLVGMRIIGQHGRDIGEVTDMTANIDTWQLQTLEVELNRATLDELKLKKTWFGSQVVHVPVSQISGATEYMVLKRSLEYMEFTGGESAEVESPTDEQSASDLSKTNAPSALLK